MIPISAHCMFLQYVTFSPLCSSESIFCNDTFLFFFLLISLSLLFQETPQAKLRFSQTSRIENLNVIAEILQKLSS